MKSLTVIDTDDTGLHNLTIKTDNRERELIAVADLSDKDREDFDYITGEDTYSPRIVKFKGSYYDINEYMRCNGKAFAEWDGNQPDSYFSGTLIKYFDSSCESVIMGSYYC